MLLLDSSQALVQNHGIVDKTRAGNTVWYDVVWVAEIEKSGK